MLLVEYSSDSSPDHPLGGHILLAVLWSQLTVIVGVEFLRREGVSETKAPSFLRLMIKPLSGRTSAPILALWSFDKSLPRRVAAGILLMQIFLSFLRSISRFGLL